MMEFVMLLLYIMLFSLLLFIILITYVFVFLKVSDKQYFLRFYRKVADLFHSRVVDEKEK
jgi:hypothetical protein